MEEKRNNNLGVGFISGIIATIIILFIIKNKIVPKKSINQMTIGELEILLDLCIKEEKYEEAAKVRDTINSLK